MKPDIPDKIRGSVILSDFNSPPSAILHHIEEKVSNDMTHRLEDRSIKKENSSINDSNNIRNGVQHRGNSQLIRNETKSDQFVKIESILVMASNSIKSSPLSSTDSKSDYSAILRDTNSGEKDSTIGHHNSSKINHLKECCLFPSYEIEMKSIKQNENKCARESKNIIDDVILAGKRKEVQEGDKEDNELKVAEEGDEGEEEEDEEEGDEEDEEEEEQEEEMSFDDYVPSPKPHSSSLSYRQVCRPILSESTTQTSSGSKLQKPSSSIFHIKESQSSCHLSQIISPSSGVEKRKLPIEIQRMKGHDFLLTMKNPTRNITDHKIVHKINKNPDEIDHLRKSNGLSNFQKKKKYEEYFT